MGMNKMATGYSCKVKPIKGKDLFGKTIIHAYELELKDDHGKITKVEVGNSRNAETLNSFINDLIIVTDCFQETVEEIQNLTYNI